MLKFYAFIENKKVQNIVPCHDYDDAIENARLQYDNPSVIEIGESRYNIAIGDKYENGMFYHFDFQTEHWNQINATANVKTDDIKLLKKEITNIKNSIKPTINTDTCLFEEYQDFRINEAVYKFTEYLNNYYIQLHIGDEIHLINASLESWNLFISNFMANKILEDYSSIESCNYTWFDAEGKVFKMKLDETMSLIKEWKNIIEVLTAHMNYIVTSIRNCKKKAEVKSIIIDYEIL